MSEYMYRTLIETYVSRMKRYFLEKKDPEMTWLEAEDALWEERLRRERLMAEREVNRVRTSHEWTKVRHHSANCRNVMFMLQSEFDAQGYFEDWKAWFLDENIGSYLPVTFGKVIRKMKDDGKYIPSTHMLLI